MLTHGSKKNLSRWKYKLIKMLTRLLMRVQFTTKTSSKKSSSFLWRWDIGWFKERDMVCFSWLHKMIFLHRSTLLHNHALILSKWKRNKIPFATSIRRLNDIIIEKRSKNHWWSWLRTNKNSSWEGFDKCPKWIKFTYEK